MVVKLPELSFGKVGVIVAFNDYEDLQVSLLPGNKEGFLFTKSGNLHYFVYNVSEKHIKAIYIYNVKKK